MKQDSYLFQDTYLCKWIKDLYIKTEAIKYLTENIGDTLQDMYHKEVFGNTIPKARKAQTKIIKWTISNLKAFVFQKKWSQKQKDNLLNGENISVYHTSDKGLTSNIYKVLSQPSNRETTQFKNG